MMSLPVSLLPVLLVCLLLTLLVAFWVLWPLRGRGPDSGQPASQLGNRVYRERLQELNADHMASRIDADTYATLKLELDRALLADSEDVSHAVMPDARRPIRAVALAVLVLLPVLSLGLYLGYFLNPKVAADVDNQRLLAPALDRILAGELPAADSEKHSLPDFMRALQRRTQADPHNAEAWTLLGMGFMQAKELDTAKAALARANELRPDDAQVAMTYVQAAIMTQQGPVDPLARRLLLHILQREPDHQGALLMLGLASLRGGEHDVAREALTHLQVLRAQLPHGSEDSQADRQISSLLAEASAVAKPVVAGGRYDIEVSVAPELARQIPPDATVFVFARDPQGPPMPVAAIRRPASQFPLRLTLTDADSLQPERLLSQQKALILQAKVSRTGDATVADWEAVAVPVQQGNRSLVRLRISESR